MNKKNFLFFNITSSLILLAFFLFPSKTKAQTFISPSFKIDFGNFNMTSGKKTSSSYTLTDTVGQNAPGQYDSTGYIVKAGFQYIYEKNIPFSFKISNLELDFGHLIPNIGSTLSNTLTISTPSPHGYDVMAIANRPLSAIGSNATIPDTKCDSGTCTDSSSDLWSDNSTYGFGFNATGDGTSSYFSTSNYFRPFPNASINQSPKALMSESVSVKDHNVTITYKVNISSIQTAGTYQNNINFIAIPKY